MDEHDDFGKFRNKLIDLAIEEVRARKEHPGVISDERLKYRWNLSDVEREHVKSCNLCRSRMHFLYQNSSPKERRDVMRKGLQRGNELTLAEIEEMLNPIDGLLLLDEEGVHQEDCPCQLLIEIINKFFGWKVLPRKKNLLERIFRS